MLVVEAEQVAGSEAKHKIFRDKRFPTCVFVDSRASVSDEDVDMTLADAAIEAVGHNLHEFRLLLIFMLRCRDVHALLDKHNISSSHHGQRIKPGCYVNIDDLCLLDNSVENFFVSGEDIELEIYDPLIDSEEAKRGQEIPVQQYPAHESVPHCEETIKNFQSLSSDTKVKNCQQVFIYARVVQRVREGHNFPCCLSYQVDIGCGRTMVVSAVKMYKIPTISDEDSSEDPSMSSTEDAQSHSMSATSAVKQVKGCLEVCLSTIGDRRLQLGLLKRLYLQWHPDLNTTRQNVCSRVLRAIKQSAIPKGSLSRGNSDQLMLTADFFDRVSPRGHLYASQSLDAKGEKPKLYGGIRRENPQPGEANRWLCQAFEDLKMAKTCSEGNNWLCFICHQAAEKAIKAVLFFKDADDHLLHPVEKQELKSLALAVGTTELIQAVEDLELITGERWRMSHPFVQWGPEIPALLYSSDMVRSSCSQAEKILTIAASLMI
ncbi:hypothetical protein C0Q70_20988 [Pomacea canaliculata]|uniref:HEPN domain-containing protein n=1 Tax=Pomacea canaliculata TaxID=400727 RepID=A0A2T7NBA4_POMCA|nr:hypothetical protein C0Q70_20988 [Pomacea canaliculata]